MSSINTLLVLKILIGAFVRTYVRNLPKVRTHEMIRFVRKLTWRIRFFIYTC